MPLSSPTPGHTPTPWVATGRYVGVEKHKSFIAECRDQNGNWTDEPMGYANAALIVKCVNAFEPMREALKSARAVVWVAAEIAAEQVGDDAQQYIAAERREVLAGIDAALKLAGAST